MKEFEDAYFVTSGPTAGARESRRIVGDYVLTGDDVREGWRQGDVAVLGAWRLDRHPATQAGYHEIPWTPPYDIPYRTLLPRTIENLLVAGRCHSATSLAVATDGAPRSVDVKSLQDQLVGQGAILEAPESDVVVGNLKW